MQQQQQDQQPQCIDLLGSSDDEQTEVGPLSARQGGAAMSSIQQTASHHSSPAESGFSGIVNLCSLAQQTSHHAMDPMQVKVRPITPTQRLPTAWHYQSTCSD